MTPFPQPENQEMVYLFGNGASSVGTLLFCLPATLQEKGKESVGGQWLGTVGPLGLQKTEPLDHTLQPLPEPGLSSPPSMMLFRPGPTNGWSVEPPLGHRVHLPPILIGLPLQDLRTQ